MYEELGSIGICTAYMVKAPLFRSWLTKNFFIGLGLHLTSTIAVYNLSGMFIQRYVEPRFVAKDSLVGELAEKYNFTVEDFSETQEETSPIQGEKIFWDEIRDVVKTWL